MSESQMRDAVAANVASRPYFPTQEPQMAQRDQDLIDKARAFCMEWYEAENEHGQLVRVYTGRVKYEDMLHEVEHLYSQLVNTSHLNTQQLIVVMCDWVLVFNMMEVKYMAVHDNDAVSFLQAMNKFILIQLMGGAHDGMRAKYVSSLVGSDRRVTVSQEENKKGIFGRFG